ncbi:unnamed protein product, partial [Timema podura]|nr:unnamed protein product [Timema podura]
MRSYGFQCEDSDQIVIMVWPVACRRAAAGLAGSWLGPCCGRSGRYLVVASLADNTPLTPRPAVADNYHCIWYGQCNTDTSTGHSQNCLYDGPAKPLDKIGKVILQKWCPHLLPSNGDEPVSTCCNTKQLQNLDTSITMAAGFIQRCPACMRNLARHLCDMTCSPSQSRFINVTEVEKSKEGKEFVNALELYVTDTYISGTYNSCKQVSVPSTGQLALDLMCGDWGASRCSPMKPQTWYTPNNQFMGVPLHSLSQVESFGTGHNYLLSRFNFVHNEMNLPHERITLHPQVLGSRLFRTKQRHLFLKSLDRAQYDPLKPGYISLDRLVAGSDAEFCERVISICTNYTNGLGMRKVEFRGSVSKYAWMERKTILDTPDRDSNPDLPVISGIVCCKSDALNQADTET